MADGKWIHGLKPDMELADAAREVLKVRLEVVEKHLPLVLHQADEDPEHVHQLRVGTRRADAALRIFRPCLSGKRYRAARARLRTIRQAAGEARDWDVFLIALHERSGEVNREEVPGTDFLIGYSLGRRKAAQGLLQGIEQDQESSFAEFVREVAAAVRSPHDKPHLLLKEHARRVIGKLTRRFNAAASGDLNEPGTLHQVRIQGKRLRYAMEVLAVCFPPAFRETLYPAVEEMQDILGAANDSQVAAARLAEVRQHLLRWPEVWERQRAGVEGLLEFHQRRVPQERTRFLEWLEGWRQAAPAFSEG